MHRTTRFLIRPAAGAVLMVTMLLGWTAVAARAADWGGWIPLADRYQGAVDYRVRESDKKREKGYEIQLRSHYPQKVTLKFLVSGTDAAGAMQSVEETVAIDAGDAKKPREAPALRVALADLATIDMENVQFDGTPPPPTPEGQPGSTAYLQKQLDAARKESSDAQTALDQANQLMLAAHGASPTLNTGPRGRQTAASAPSDSRPGDAQDADHAVRDAQARVDAAQKRVDALEKQLATSGTAKLTLSQIKDLLDTAEKSMAAKDWPRSETTLRSLLSGSGDTFKDADRAALTANLGIALENQNKLADAEAAFRDAAKLVPQVPNYQNDLASALAAQGKLPEAEAALREAIRLDPKLAAYRDNLGSVLMGEQQYADAAAAFQEAVRLDPDEPSYQQHLKEAQAKQVGK